MRGHRITHTLHGSVSKKFLPVAERSSPSSRVMVIASHLPSRKCARGIPSFRHSPAPDFQTLLSRLCVSSLSSCPAVASTNSAVRLASFSLTAPRARNALRVPPSAYFTRGGESRLFWRTSVYNSSATMEIEYINLYILACFIR